MRLEELWWFQRHDIQILRLFQMGFVLVDSNSIPTSQCGQHLLVRPLACCDGEMRSLAFKAAT